MNARKCFWNKYRATCQQPDKCTPTMLQMPVNCIRCGWDADAEWERCMGAESEIAKFVDEIIAGEEANDDPNWLPPF